MPKKPSASMPPHYRSLSLRNFRGFKKAEDIQLAPLTFLVGPNSSGKSSLFDALLLVSQSAFEVNRFATQVPNWVGRFVDLGSFSDAVYKHDTNLTIEIGIEVSPHFMKSEDYWGAPVEKAMKIRYALRTSKDDPVGRLVSMTVTDALTGQNIVVRYEKNKIILRLLGLTLKYQYNLKFRDVPFYAWFNREFDLAVKKLSNVGHKSAWRRISKFLALRRMYSLIEDSERVSSGRSAPKRWYSIPETRFRLGTSRSRVFDAVQPFMIEEARFYAAKRRAHQKHSLQSALNDLDIGDRVKDARLSPYHLAITIRDNVTGVTSNLIDVGYGASQVIPVLKACLSNSEGPLFIEQPEIHLHPKAQGTVADLICTTSRYRQVIVETHSVHMINRARIMVARGDLPASHVIVNYVERKHDGSHVLTIPILDNGDFGADWPEGFFDERYEDTMNLLKLKNERNPQ